MWKKKEKKRKKKEKEENNKKVEWQKNPSLKQSFLKKTAWFESSYKKLEVSTQQVKS